MAQKVKRKQKKEPSMFSDKIKLNLPAGYSEMVVNRQALNKVHSDLLLGKPCIFFFISDEEMLKLNVQVLNHDFYTDVMTFDYEDDKDIKDNEIMISYDRVKENAKTNEVSFLNELHRVCIHGLLHLAGQNDKSDEEQKKMSSLEDHYLNLYCST